MSSEKIRAALTQIEDDPFKDEHWTTLEDILTSGGGGSELIREMELTRSRLARVRAWSAMVRLLELQVQLEDGEFAASLYGEIGRIYHEELLRGPKALEAYKRVLEQTPDNKVAQKAVNEIDFGRVNLQVSVEHYLVEALDADDPVAASKMMTAAAETMFRYGPQNDTNVNTALDYAKQATTQDPKNGRALTVASTIYASQSQWQEVADVLAKKVQHSLSREERIAAAHQRVWVLKHHLVSEGEALESAMAKLLELDPSDEMASAHFAKIHSDNGDWDQLAAIYAARLQGGHFSRDEEQGLWVQLGMIHFRQREDLGAAFRYFEKVRRVNPAHRGMLSFYREYCTERGEQGKLVKVLSDALEKADDKQRGELQTEIEELGSHQDNARETIDELKRDLRANPDTVETRDKLKELYRQTGSYNALVELYRQDLQRLPEDAGEQRVAVLQEIAAVYRDDARSDTALLTVLTQILHYDEGNIDAVRDLVSVHASLGRTRDLLTAEKTLSELTDSPEERVSLLRSVARRWLDELSNAQNAILSYEALLEATEGQDPEAEGKLEELYQKRRMWKRLYELYEARAARQEEGEDRTKSLVSMARLCAERLDRGEEAIRLLKEVMVFDPHAEGVLDLLERQAERGKDHGTVSYVLDRRIQSAPDDKTKLTLLQKLGVLTMDKMGDAEAAHKIWRRVLDVSPGHKRALRILRQAHVEANDWDGLEELYVSQRDFEGLADILSTTADKHEDQAQRIDLSFRAARVFAERMENPQRATRSYERVLTDDPDNLEAAQALIPVYTEEEKWSRLPALYQVLEKKTDNVDEKVELLNKMAEIAGGPLANKQAALDYVKQAYALRPEEAQLARIREWSARAGEWSTLMTAVQEQLTEPEADLSSDQQRELRLMMARVNATEADNPDQAVATYKALLEENPDDIVAADELETLLRAADRRDELRWLLELRAGRLEGEERASALEEWATVEEDVFGESAKSIELLQRVVKDDSTRVSALTSLRRLLEEREDYSGAVVVLGQHRDAVLESERIEFETKIAQLSLEKLADPTAAFDACQRAAALEEDHPPIVAILESLMKAPEVRSGAAGLLEGVYRRRGEPNKRVGALRAMLETVDDRQRRLDLCEQLAEVFESDLDQPSEALAVVLNTLQESPQEARLWERAQDLARASGRTTELSDAFRTHLLQRVENDDAPKIDEELAFELCDAAARLTSEELGDPEGAIPYLNKQLKLQPQNLHAFERLAEILSEAEKWPELETHYSEALDNHADDESMRVRLLGKVASVADEHLKAPEKAIGYYQQLRQLEPDHADAGIALDRLYEGEERHAELVELLEARVAAGDPDEPTLRHRIVQLRRERLNETTGVVAHLAAVLDADPDNRHTRQLAERCLEDDALKAGVAEVLDRAYVAIDDPRDLARVLQVRLAADPEPTLRLEILRRAADLYDERLKDDGKAFEMYAELAPLEPDDQVVRERLLGIGDRLGAHDRVVSALRATAKATEDNAQRGEILLEAAARLEQPLNQYEEAVTVYKEVLELSADEPHTKFTCAERLVAIYAESGQHSEHADALLIQVSASDDPTQQGNLLARCATLYEDVLEDDAKAVEIWERRREAEPDNEATLVALERLHFRAKNWRDGVGILLSLERVVADDDRRREALSKAASTLEEQLEDHEQAIEVWQTIRGDFGSTTKNLGALARLYQKTEQWQELADTYEESIPLAETEADQAGTFALLGRVQQNRLENPNAAIGSYRDVLLRDPENQIARSSLEQLLDADDDDVRRDAAECLEPVYDASADHEGLLRVYEVQYATTTDPSDRIGSLESAFGTASGQLEDAARAFNYAERGVNESVEDDSLGTWIERVVQLAPTCDAWARTTKLFEDAAPLVLDADLQRIMRMHAGAAARDQLNEPDRAIVLFEAVTETFSDDTKALDALRALYGKTNRPDDLLDATKRRAAAASETAERASLLHDAAELLAGDLSRPDDAITTYEEILDGDFDPKAVTALEKLYTKAERYDDLVVLHERTLESTMEQADVDTRVKIARVASSKLGNHDRALDELEIVLGVDPRHETAATALEEMVAKVDDSAVILRAGALLQKVYIRGATFEKVRDIMNVQLKHCDDPVQRSALLTRLTQVQEEQLEDYSAALHTLSLRLKDDPRDVAIWDEVARVGRVVGENADEVTAGVYTSTLDGIEQDDEQTSALATRAARLLGQADKPEEALKWYRRAYVNTPDSTELFVSIDELLVKTGAPDRVEHYAQAIETTYDEPLLVERLGVLAGLHQASGNAAEAVESYRRVVELSPGDAGALDALTSLYGDLDDDQSLAELYEERANTAESPENAATFRVQLADLLADNEPERALDQLDRVVQALPEHAGATERIRGYLDSENHQVRAIELLRPLYTQQADWKSLIGLNERRVKLAFTPGEKVDVLLETVSLWEDQGGNPKQAFTVACEAVLLVGDDARAREAAERLAEELDDYRPLADTYEKAAEATDDEYVKRALYERLATIYDDEVNDPRAALGALSRLSELDPSEVEPLHRMDDMCMLLADWPNLVNVLTKKAEALSGDGERAEVLRRLGEVKGDMLEDSVGAGEAYERALELEPDSAGTVDRLLAITRPSNPRRSAELLRMRVELESDDDDLKRQLTLEAAGIHENVLEEPDEAAVLLQSALDYQPNDREVLGRLDVLFAKQERYADQVDMVGRLVELTPDAPERQKLQNHLGDIHLTKLESPYDALEQYRSVLQADPDNTTAIDRVITVARKHSDLSVEASVLLEPILAEHGRYDDLVEVLELRADGQSDPDDRAQTLRAIATVQEEQLETLEVAMKTVLRALEAKPEDPSVHEHAERVAAVTGDFDPYAVALKTEAEKTFDALLQVDLYSRLAAIAHAKLKDNDRAIDAYLKASEYAEDPRPMLSALDDLYRDANEHQKRAEILERRLDLANLDAEQVTHSFSLAVLRRDAFSDGRGALTMLQRIADQDPEHAPTQAALEGLLDDAELFEDAAESLESIYRVTDNPSGRAQLRNKRIDFAQTPGDRVRLRLELAQMMEDEVGDLGAAQGVLEQALLDDVSETDTLSQLQRLAGLNAEASENAKPWAQAATAVQAAVAASREGTGGTGISLEAARDLYVLAAGWQADKVQASDAAEKLYRAALEVDPEAENALLGLERIHRVPDREVDLIATLRRLAVLAQNPGSEIGREPNELRRAAKELAHAPVGDAALVETILREVLASDDTTRWALSELADVCAEKEGYDEQYTLIRRQIDLAVDGEELQSLRHRAAIVAETKLDRASDAADLYEVIFEEDPKDEGATKKLRELYAKLERHDDMLRLIERLTDLEGDADVRAGLRLESARLCLNTLNLTSEGISHLNAVLDEKPGHPDAVELLAELLEREGRDDDLADLLKTQIATAQENEDQASEKRFRLRLAAVSETRLNDPEAAIEGYLGVLALDAQHRDALSALVRLYEQGENNAAAATMTERLIEESQPADLAQLCLKGRDLYLAAGDSAGAIRVLETGFKTARGADVEVLPLRDALKSAYRDSEKWEELATALADEAGDETDPNSIVALLRQAADLRADKCSDAAGAAELLEKAIVVREDDRELLLELCDHYTASGRADAAIASLNRIVESYKGRRSKDLSGIHKRLSAAHLAQGNTTEALDQLESARKMDPGNVAVLIDLGQLSLDLATAEADADGGESAAAHLKRANNSYRSLLLQRLDADSPITKADVFCQLALVCRAEGDNKKALQMLDRALSNEKGHARAQELREEFQG